MYNKQSFNYMGLSENSVPLHPMVLLIIIPTFYGYFIGGIAHFQTLEPKGPGGQVLSAVLRLFFPRKPRRQLSRKQWCIVKYEMEI